MADGFMFMGFDTFIAESLEKTINLSVPDAVLRHGGNRFTQKMSLSTDKLARPVLFHRCRDTKQAVRLRCLPVNGFSAGMISRAASFRMDKPMTETSAFYRVGERLDVTNPSLGLLDPFRFENRPVPSFRGSSLP